MDVNGKISFEESQQFRVKWVWALILLSVSVSIVLPIVISLSGNKPTKESLLPLLILIPLELTMLYLFYVARLDVTVTNEAIYYRWWPFQRKGRRISQADIVSAEMRKSPAMQYGMHRLPKYGVAHSVGPGHGIQFVLVNGRRIFIGSANAELFLKAVQKNMSALANVK